MLIANQKRKENIAEYILYMWQVEDIIRGFNLDIDLIQKNIIDQYQQDDSVKDEIRKWYEELIAMMRIEGVMQKGHLQINKNSLALLSDLHLRLLKSAKHTSYHEAYGKVLNELAELKAQDAAEGKSDIEHCFTFLYGLLMLRLQQKEISTETKQSAAKVQKLLVMLAKTYHYEQDNPDEDTVY